MSDLTPTTGFQTSFHPGCSHPHSGFSLSWPRPLDLRPRPPGEGTSGYSALEERGVFGLLPIKSHAIPSDSLSFLNLKFTHPTKLYLLSLKVTSYLLSDEKREKELLETNWRYYRTARTKGVGGLHNSVAEPRGLLSAPAQ